jgi:hypothetical protein
MHLLYVNWTEVNAENRRDREPIQISPAKFLAGQPR